MPNRPEWDINAAFGDVGEHTVRALLDDPTVEVKRKRLHDLAFYVEQQCDFGGRGQYRDSGITISRAEYWAYVIGESGIVVLLPTRIVRDAITQPSARAVNCAQDPQYPTRGKLVNLAAILQRCR